MLKSQDVLNIFPRDQTLMDMAEIMNYKKGSQNVETGSGGKIRHPQ